MSEEIDALLGKADRYLRSARLLQDDGDLASAASRAYSGSRGGHVAKGSVARLRKG